MMVIKDSERQVLETFDTFYKNLDDNYDNLDKQTARTAAILTLSEVINNGNARQKETLIGRTGEGKPRLRTGEIMNKTIKGLLDAITDWWAESETKVAISKILYLGMMIYYGHVKIDLEIVKIIVNEGQCMI